MDRCQVSLASCEAICSLPVGLQPCLNCCFIYRIEICQASVCSGLGFGISCRPSLNCCFVDGVKVSKSSLCACCCLSIPCCPCLNCCFVNLIEPCIFFFKILYCIRNKIRVNRLKISKLSITGTMNFSIPCCCCLSCCFIY